MITPGDQEPILPPSEQPHDEFDAFLQDVNTDSLAELQLKYNRALIDQEFAAAFVKHNYPSVSGVTGDEASVAASAAVFEKFIEENEARLKAEFEEVGGGTEQDYQDYVASELSQWHTALAVIEQGVIFSAHMFREATNQQVFASAEERHASVTHVKKSVMAGLIVGEVHGMKDGLLTVLNEVYEGDDFDPDDLNDQLYILREIEFRETKSERTIAIELGTSLQAVFAVHLPEADGETIRRLGAKVYIMITMGKGAEESREAHIDEYIRDARLGMDVASEIKALAREYWDKAS